MRKYTHYLGEQTYPVIEFRRRPRYVNGEKTDILDSSYTIMLNYEQIAITVEDNGTAVTQEQVREAADNGTPVQMVFKDLELTIRGTKTPWEIAASGRASEAVLMKGK